MSVSLQPAAGGWRQRVAAVSSLRDNIPHQQLHSCPDSDKSLHLMCVLNNLIVCNAYCSTAAWEALEPTGTKYGLNDIVLNYSQYCILFRPQLLSTMLPAACSAARFTPFSYKLKFTLSSDVNEPSQSVTVSGEPLY